jgi:DNA-binding NarL/FixJ family response regulator
MNLMKIAIYVCNSLFGEGIRQLLGNGVASSNAMVCSDSRELAEFKPHLLITDFRMFSRLSLDGLCKEKVKILLLGTECMPSILEEQLADLIPKGLSGIVSTAIDLGSFKRAIETVMSGELWFDRKKLRDVIFNINRDQTPKSLSLTRRETEIIKLICTGYRNKEIMRKLKVSEQSVKSHLNRIYKKLGVIDRLQLAIYAMKHWPEYMRGPETNPSSTTPEIRASQSNFTRDETKVALPYKP